MTDRKVIDRILKCLRLAKSANEHEAAAALEKARQLMDEYHITDSDMALAEVEEATARASRTNRPPVWENVLAATIKDALCVQSFITEFGDRQFIGIGASAEIAAYAFGVLFRQIKRHRKDYIAGPLRRCTLARKRMRADAFCEGWARAVYMKVVALAPSEADPRVSQYLAELHPWLVKIAGRGNKVKGSAAHNDYWRGYDRGNNVNLNPGVGGVAKPALLS